MLKQPLTAIFPKLFSTTADTTTDASFYTGDPGHHSGGEKLDTWNGGTRSQNVHHLFPTAGGGGTNTSSVVGGQPYSRESQERIFENPGISRTFDVSVTDHSDRDSSPESKNMYRAM